MPLYEYECQNGHRFEVLRPMSQRNDPVHCEKCRGLARPLMSVVRFKIDWNSVLKKMTPEEAPNDAGYHPKWDKFTP